MGIFVSIAWTFALSMSLASAVCPEVFDVVKQENATSTEPQNRTTSTEIEVQVQTTVSAVRKYIIDSPSDPEGLGYVHRRQQIQ